MGGQRLQIDVSISAFIAVSSISRLNHIITIWRDANYMATLEMSFMSPKHKGIGIISNYASLCTKSKTNDNKR